MKTIKAALLMAFVVSSIACKNESQVIDENPSCEDLVAMAQGDLDLANARMSVLSSGRSGLTNERNDILDLRDDLGHSVSQAMLTDIDARIQEFDQSVSTQNEVIVDARRALVAAIQACPSADQAALQIIDVDGSDLENEVDKVEVAEESAREMIDRLNPMIVEAYEEIQRLEAEKEEALIAREEAAHTTETVETIVALRAEIDAAIASIDEELLEARRRHVQFSDARRMAYLTLDSTVSAGEAIEAQN